MSNQTHLNLFLFSVGGVSFAIDAEQAAGISPYTGDDTGLFWFHEELCFGGREVIYQSPTIVTLKTHDAQPYRVIIDSMEDIAEFNTNDMIPFPAILEPFCLHNGMWGILPLHGRMILLLDFDRLRQGRLSA